ncbi:hypothetical protein F4778DRAFT_88651 [Xylariomycetidae sp. FL2044]|nr:hypothetical protein F4778DRAFT_88651 [Xylariomycetidae sp. FL2044]
MLNRIPTISSFVFQVEHFTPPLRELEQQNVILRPPITGASKRKSQRSRNKTTIPTSATLLLKTRARALSFPTPQPTSAISQKKKPSTRHSHHVVVAPHLQGPQQHSCHRQPNPIQIPQIQDRLLRRTAGHQPPHAGDRPALAADASGMATRLRARQPGQEAALRGAGRGGEGRRAGGGAAPGAGGVGLRLRGRRPLGLGGGGRERGGREARDPRTAAGDVGEGGGDEEGGNVEVCGRDGEEGTKGQGEG